MSPAEKPARFGMLRGVREAAEHPAEELPPQAAPVREGRSDAAQEPFSTTLSRGMKRRLKKASAEEGRKQYLLVEEALADYLEKHHPDVG